MIFSDFRSALKSLVYSLALSSLLLLPSAHAQKPNIVSWGENMSSWTTALGVTEVRGGCDIAPADCEPYLENLAAEQSSSGYYYVSFTMNPSNGVSYAEDWSKLSLTYKHMLEIDYDDFIGDLEDLQAAGELSSPNTFVADVIAATKAYNPNLAFGITLYEDSLTHAMTTTTLTASTRAKIQYVHFYLHYRENASKWSSYLPTVKALFPNAKIIAGAYPYDRIDFLPCAQGATAQCTASQEQAYFKEALENQLASFKAGQVSGVEFYFGYFGMPQDWAGWTVSDKICLPSRLSTCYANSSALQSISKEVVQAYSSSSSSSSSSSGSLSFDYPTLNFGSEAVGETTPATYVTVTNTGSSTVTFHELTLGGSDPSDFSRSNDCPAYLGSGSRCSLVLYFTPKAAGTRIANFSLSTSAGTYTYTIVGTGTD